MSKKVIGYVIVIPGRLASSVDSRRGGTVPKYFYFLNTARGGKQLQTRDTPEEGCRFAKQSEARLAADILNKTMGWDDTPNHPAAFVTELYGDAE